MKNGSCRDGGHTLKLRITMQNLCPSRENGLWQSWLPAGTTTEHPSQPSDKTCAGNMKGLPSLNSNWAIFSFRCLVYLLFWTLTVKTHTKAFSRALGLCMQFQQSDDLFIHFSNHSNRARCRKQQTLSVCVWFAGRNQQNRVREAVFPVWRAPIPSLPISLSNETPFPKATTLLKHSYYALIRNLIRATSCL